jgi:nitroreductase/NAD-dependent dihydropyrimidine dehydrogenase PreA subunit
MQPVIINHEICNQDGICSDVCPRKLIDCSTGVPVPVAGIEDLCIRCGHCMAVCPSAAISVDGVNPEDCQAVDKNRRATDHQLDHLMKSRRSIRIYQDRPVEREMIQHILDTCRYAPTGSNAQQVNWIFTDDQTKIRELGQLTIDWMKLAIATNDPLSTRLPLAGIVGGWEKGEDRLFRGAPLVLMTHSPEMGSLPLESCVIAMTYFDLVASSMGLGTCWIGLFMVAATQHPPIRRFLGIPSDHRLYGTMVAGYPKYKYQRIPARKQPSVAWL